MRHIGLLLVYGLYCFKIVHSQPQWKDLAQYAECVDRWLDRKPELLHRFTRDQIAWLCERTDSWQQFSMIPADQRADDFLTRKQRLWLDSVRTCKGIQCLSRVKKDQGRVPEVPPSPRSAVDEQRPKFKPRPRNSDLHITIPPPSIMNEQNDDPLKGIFPESKKRPAEFFEAPMRLPLPPINYKDEFKRLNLLSVSTVNIVQSQDDLTEFEQHLLIEGPSGTKCTTRRLIAYLCPRLINQQQMVDQIFPTFFQQMRLGGRKSRRKLIKMLNKGQKLKRKCNAIDEYMPKEASFQQLASCSNPTWLQERQQNVTEKCNRVLQAVSAEEAFKHSTEDFRFNHGELYEQFAHWTHRCLQFQQNLRQNGMTLESWKRKPNGDSNFLLFRQKRQFHDDLRVTRKEIRQMKDDERNQFFKALQLLKSEKIDGRSKYDLLVIYHTPQESPGAHWGPAFLPFHRELLKQLEIALRQIDPDVYLPYWDSTLDDRLPDPRDSILWTDEFFGNGDGIVTSGPFANWSATHELSTVAGMQTLFRDVGVSQYGGLFKEADWEFALSRSSFNDFTACVDPTFELVHGLVHMFVGGYMADIGISPNDPTFFLHHAFIDNMWEEFRRIKQTPEQQETEYPPNDKTCNNYHYGDAQMFPFTIKNIDGLSRNYTAELYSYYPRPRCSDTVQNCGSKYLYCDTREYSCVSKILDGGNCTGFEGTDICFFPDGLDGSCTPEGKCEANKQIQIAPNGEEATDKAGANTNKVEIDETTVDTELRKSTTMSSISDKNAMVSHTVASTTEVSIESPTSAKYLRTTTSQTLPTIKQSTTIESSFIEDRTTTIIPEEMTLPPNFAISSTKEPSEFKEESVPAATKQAPGEPSNWETTLLPETAEDEGSSTTITPDLFETTIANENILPVTKQTPGKPNHWEPTPPQETAEDEDSSITEQPNPFDTTTLATKPQELTTEIPKWRKHTVGEQPSALITDKPTTQMIETEQLTETSKKLTSAPITTTTTTTVKPEPTSNTALKTKVKETSHPTEETQAPFPVVWFSITIIRGSIYYKTPVIGAQAKTCGMNVPTGYTQSLYGRVLQTTGYPEYTAGALVQVMDPDKAGYFPMVQASIEVYDESGRPCQSYCYNASIKRYAECQNRVRISSNEHYSDPIEFRKTQKEAMEALWKIQGYRRQRIPDYLMFKCE